MSPPAPDRDYRCRKICVWRSICGELAQNTTLCAVWEAWDFPDRALYLPRAFQLKEFREKKEKAYNSENMYINDQ
jgi:hypothetical protein